MMDLEITRSLRIIELVTDAAGTWNFYFILAAISVFLKCLKHPEIWQNLYCKDRSGNQVEVCCICLVTTY